MSESLQTRSLREFAESEASLDGSEQGIILSVGQSRYCVPILQVSSIIEYEGATAIPHCSHYIEGAINLRGNIVPVVNLGTFLGVQSLPMSEGRRRFVVIAESPNPSDPEDKIVFGLLIDVVVRIFDMAGSSVQPISADGGRSDLSGLVMLDSEGDGKSGVEMIGVLDLASIASQVTGGSRGLSSMEF